MTTPAKHAKDMTPEEYAQAKAEAKSGKHPAAEKPFVRRPGITEWEYIASAIRAMSIPEFTAFQKRYGIAIVSNDTKKLKRFDDMSFDEKQKFLVLHNISGETAARVLRKSETGS